MVWSLKPQSGQSGEVCIWLSILCKYDSGSGDFPVRSCAIVRLVLHGGDSSDIYMFGGTIPIVLFGCLLASIRL